MAKKKFNYKDVKINEEELSITKIGEIATENKSSIFMFLIFGILIVFVFFLPTITDYFDKEKKEVTEPIIEEKKDDPEDNKQKEITYYDLNSPITLEKGLEINNIKIINNSISFTITNSNSENYYFKEKNYFVELYTANQTLLERIILTKDILNSNTNKEYTYNIKNETAINAQKIAFIDKSIGDYPNINLEKINDEEILTCIKGFETITYKFQQERLVKINDKIDYIKNVNDFEYQTALALWQSKSSTYNSLEGVTSAFISNASGFNVNTDIDLTNAKISSLDNEYYYPAKTISKMIKFEMEARGFSCK